MNSPFTHEYEIIRIVYVSNASTNLTLENIHDIERSSIKNNKAAGITGFLTYKENTFMQFLEGPELDLQDYLRK